MNLRTAEAYRLSDTSLDFVGRANIWVADSLVDDSSTLFTQALVAEAFSATSARQIEVIAYDDALTGICSPFQDINSGGERLLRVMTEPQDLREAIRSLRHHVQDVSNVIQGRSPTLIDFRATIGFPVESFKLLVIATDYGMLDEDIQNSLLTLIKAGPRNGLTVLVHSITVDDNPYLMQHFQCCSVRGTRVFSLDGRPLGEYVPTNADSLISSANLIANELASASAPTVPFEYIEPSNDTWAHSSKDGITFNIGRFGLSRMSVTLGDEVNQRHNALITGAVGQGKSNLISVIIHSLCHRYPPSELQLYLLDFKEGVTLQPLAGTGPGEALPHARVLGLEADREFGLSVLQHLFTVYKERMARFKAAGVQGISAYREKYPDDNMPRILLVVDEFQMMFSEKDHVSDQIATLLQRGVRLFRASGIHVVLASQTIGGNNSLIGSAAEGLFGQVPIRIALKNSLSESFATLGAGNDAATRLRSREAVVNLDYGNLSANRKTTIAYADDSILLPMRRSWSRQCTDTPSPYIFYGERAYSLEDDADHLSRLKANSSAPTALFGKRIEVDGTCFEATMSMDVGRNVAVVGPSNAVPVLFSAALSLAQQDHDNVPEIYVLDFLRSDREWEAKRNRHLDRLSSCGAKVTLASENDATELVPDLVSKAEQPRPSGARHSDVYILGLGLERMRDTNQFDELCRQGPAAGIHVLGWWLKLESFQEHVGYGGSAFFDIKFAYGLDSQSTRRFFDDPLLEWSPHPNRMMAWDSSYMARPVRVIPYTSL